MSENITETIATLRKEIEDMVHNQRKIIEALEEDIAQPEKIKPNEEKNNDSTNTSI